MVIQLSDLLIDYLNCVKMLPSKKKFSADEDDLLIAFVEKNSCLYDSNHEDYKKHNVKEVLWQKAAEITGKPVIACKTRWKHLRDYRNRQKNKQMDYEASSTSSLKLLSSEHRGIDANTNVEQIKFHDIETTFNPSSPKNVASEENDVPFEYSRMRFGQKRRRLDLDCQANMDFQSECPVVQEFMAAPATATVSDDLSKFFASIEATTRKLPQEYQIKIKRAISNVVYDNEELNLKNQRERKRAIRERNSEFYSLFK